MKTHTESEDDFRLDKIENIIKRLYGRMGPREVEQAALQYEIPFMEMLEVIAVQKDTVILQHLFENDVFENVVAPPEIHFFLKKGDVFLMTLGRRRDRWFVLWMSPPYEGMDID